MKWLLAVAAVWYWWRLYTLSFNPSNFPDQKYAHVVWDRRSNYSFLLGAAVVTAFLRAFGAIHEWWTFALAFAVCLAAMVFVQPMLVGLIIFNRAGLTIVKSKVGIKLRSPLLAPFAWTYYLTKDEKRKAGDAAGS